MAEQQVQLSDLSSKQLQDVKQQLEEELEHLTNSFGSLKAAHSKYKSCLSDIGEIKPSHNGNKILVPLTASLYVPGRIADPEHVVIDIGTGYYVKKTRKEATTHYTTKTTYVQKNLDTLQDTVERKQSNLQSCMEVLQARIQAETSAAAAGAGGGKGGKGGKA